MLGLLLSRKADNMMHNVPYINAKYSCGFDWGFFHAMAHINMKTLHINSSFFFFTFSDSTWLTQWSLWTSYQFKLLVAFSPVQSPYRQH